MDPIVYEIATTKAEAQNVLAATRDLTERLNIRIIIVVTDAGSRKGAPAAVVGVLAPVVAVEGLLGTS